MIILALGILIAPTPVGQGIADFPQQLAQATSSPHPGRLGAWTNGNA
ncbi:hypothetical protein [Streptomyces finlayi]|nr:hypothetical protein [Streptomyces finlayi]